MQVPDDANGPDSVPESYWQLRRAVAYWHEPEQGLIEVRGKDAGSYLQSQLTQDLLALTPGSAAPAALVERKGHLRALMLACRMDAEKYWLLPAAGPEALFEHLEAFHFVEAVEIEVQPEWLRLRLEGPLCFEILQELSGHQLAGKPRWSVQSVAIPGGSLWVIPDSYSGESGALLLCRQAYAQALISMLADLEVPELNPAALERARLEAGQPRWGVDMDESTLLPETGLEKQAVNYDKGCYLGQEVIARIRSYGVVPRALIGLAFAGEPKLGPLKLEGKDIGRLSSYGFSPKLQGWIGLAFLHKSQRENGRELGLEINGTFLATTVRRLPFYTPPSAGEQAKALLEQALEIFANGDENHAIPLLEAALAKDPHLADAYESLGVILSRQGRLEEAIAVMQQLAELDPDEPMARTNLSRFYMLQGDKETAETHMAEATRLNMLRSQRQFAAQQQQAQIQAQELAQKQELMDMFLEVLETEDANDLVANFGLGKALLDLGRPAEALPYLDKATAVDPLYSAAWLQLGKALSAMGDTARAYEVYTRGIEAATEKGDLMPLKEMEQRRAGLPSAGSGTQSMTENP